MLSKCGSPSELYKELTPAHAVVLIATKVYKAPFRYQNAERETRSIRFGSISDGISHDEYHQARDELNAQGIFLVRSAITKHGRDFVENVHPEIFQSMNKLNAYAGSFSTEKSKKNCKNRGV